MTPIRIAPMIRGTSVLVVALLPACTKQFVHVPEPVGPAPIVRPSPTIGRLVVATEEIPPVGDATYTNHEPYTVLDSSGRVVKEVPNDTGADVVELESGRYVIRAESIRMRVIAVDVQIVPGTTTEVHLDGNWAPKAPSTPSTLVLGPDGSPIGYRFAPAAAVSDASSARRP